MYPYSLCGWVGLCTSQDADCALSPLLPPHTDEQDLLLVHHPDMPENPRVLRVVLLGAPNAGKSTLSNQLLGRKVCYILDCPRPPHTHILFISSSIVLERSGTSLGTSLFLAGVSCLQEGAHHSLPSSGGHHREGGPGGAYLQQDRGGR